MSRTKAKSHDDRLKRSFQGLANHYFGTGKFLGQRAFTHDDLSIHEFTQSVLDYQLNALSGPAAELVSLMGAKPELFQPRWLIAPYFPLRKSLAWLKTNLECLQAAISLNSANSCAMIAVELGVLKTNDAWKEIVDKYCDLKPRTLFLWIESFDEDQAEEQDLLLFCKIVRRISQKGVVPVNLFGGFFSCLAQCVGLGGFAHGLIYGENKSFTPVLGGGQPPPRYYLKPAHVSMNVRGAELLLSGVSAPAYLENVCDCTICAGLFRGEDDLTRFFQFAEASDQGKFMPRAYALCRYHFLFARLREIRDMEPLAPQERIEAIMKNVKFLQEINAEEYAEHLNTWMNVIKLTCADE
ncbi:MAG: hypothetical protein M3Y72_02085 [Acidobacteriota bacterium]|nr:hypothetical protein [Acidobacteriota bacterium]